MILKNTNLGLEKNFHGKIIYELDNKNNYEVYRDFLKKNPKIYNQTGEDISKEFGIDKNKGSEFFKEQTKIEEDMLCSTAVIEQGESELNKDQQNIVIQKLTNLISAGNDNISFKKIIEKLNKKQLEEVGTSKTLERPINIVTEKLNKLNQQKNEIELVKDKKYEIENQIKIIEKKQKELEEKIKIIKIIKENKENEKIDNEIILLNNKTIEETIKKINELKNKKNIKKIKYKKINYILLIIFFIINILFTLFNPIIILNYILYGIFIIYFLFLGINTFSNIKKNKKIKLEKNQLENQIFILEENKNNKEKEIQELKNKLKYKIENNINNLQLEFKNENIKELNLPLEEIKKYLEEIETEYRNTILQLQQLNLEKENINQLINKQANIYEQITQLQNEKNNLNMLGNAIQIAKNTLEEAYNIMKTNVTPEFIQKLNQIVKKITKDEYNNIKFNDSEGITVENKNGQYIPIYMLSIGTIDQIYFALRLSVLQQLTTEKIPIILDEIFAYYDNGRLKNILQYLYEEYNDYQIILLTCSNREKEVLDNLKIPYSLTELV